MDKDKKDELKGKGELGGCEFPIPTERKFHFIVYGGKTDSLAFGPISKTTLASVFALLEGRGATVTSVLIPGKGIGRGYMGMMWGTHFYLDDEIDPENVLLVIEPRSVLKLLAESIPKKEKR